MFIHIHCHSYLLFSPGSQPIAESIRFSAIFLLPECGVGQKKYTKGYSDTTFSPKFQLLVRQETGPLKYKCTTSQVVHLHIGGIFCIFAASNILWCNSINLINNG